MYLRCFSILAISLCLYPARVLPGEDPPERIYDVETHGLIQPKITHRQAPELDESVMKTNKLFTIVFEVVFGKNGEIMLARLKRGNSRLSEEAKERILASVMQWHFEPGQLNGEAVNVRMFFMMTLNHP